MVSCGHVAGPAAEVPPEDWRGHCITTLFGEVTVRLPRFLCIACNRTELGVCWPNARLRVGPPVSAACQPERAVGQRGMIPPFFGHSRSTSCMSLICYARV